MTGRKLVDKLPRELVAHPFQVLICWVFILAAFNLLAGFGDSPTLRQFGPSSYFVYYWCLSSLIGSPLMLWGLRKSAKSKRAGALLSAWRIERLGLILQGSATLVFGIIIVTAKGPEAILSSIMYLTLTMAYGVRLLVLNRKERELRQLADPSVTDGG